MRFDPIYWIPILSIIVIMLIGVVSGFLRGRMWSKIEKSSLFFGVAVLIFFAVHLSITGLILAFLPHGLSRLQRNWLVFIIYLSLTLMVYFLSDRWLTRPSERSIGDLERRMRSLEKKLSGLERELEEELSSLGSKMSNVAYNLRKLEDLDDTVDMASYRVSELSDKVENSESASEMGREIVEKIDEVKKFMKGSVSRIEGIEFQEWSYLEFQNFGFDVENQVYSNSDHVLRLDGEIVGIVEVKNWTLTNRNRTVNESRLRGEDLEKARELEVPLIAHVNNKEVQRNWFHVFEPGELEDPKETTPDWLREENLSRKQEGEKKKNYREFHRFVDGLITG